MGTEETYQGFLAFSAAATGFSVFHLQGTGQAESYLATVTEIVGEETVHELIAAYRAVADAAETDEAALERGMRKHIMSDPKLGPIARNVIKLWYVATWHQLPSEWRETYRATDKDRTFVVSPEAYGEGLLWPAIGANPSGTKPFGYGIWATPPRIETT